MLNEAMFSSEREDWETPKHVFDSLDKIFGFTLDVCATPENAKCDRFFTLNEDGLSQSWSGEVCWMNPPYGETIVDWVKKASEEDATVVCLIPARTDTKWFHEYVMKADEILLVKGRIKFVGGKHSAPFPSCIAIYYSNPLKKLQQPIFNTVIFNKIK